MPPTDDRGVTFVDLGAFDGASTRMYEKKWKVAFAYLWEPQPGIVVQPPQCDHEIIRAAAWVKTGSTTFYIGKHDDPPSQGSSLLGEKTTGGLSADRSIQVQAEDFADWCVYNLQPSFVVVKMNIEGAEYEVLPWVYSANVMGLPREWHISFHNEKVGKTEADDENIRAMLIASGFMQRDSPFPGCEGWTR